MLNIAVFLHGFTKGVKARPKKTMRKIARRRSGYEISVRRSCHGLDVPDGFILPIVAGKSSWPSTPRDGHLARHRPVAGLLLDALLFGHDAFPKSGSCHLCRQTKCACTWKSHDLIEKPKNAFPDHAQKRARDARANRTQRRMLCFSSSAL